MERVFSRSRVSAFLAGLIVVLSPGAHVAAQQTIIGFEEFAVGTLLSSQLRHQGALFETVTYDPGEPGSFSRVYPYVEIVGDFVPPGGGQRASLAPPRLQQNDVLITFLDPATNARGVTDHVSVLLDSASPNDGGDDFVHLRAFDPSGNPIGVDTLPDSAPGPLEVVVPGIHYVIIDFDRQSEDAGDHYDNLTFDAPEPAGPLACVTPPEGLVSWWPADGNGNDTVGGQTATAYDGATFAPAMVDDGFKMSNRAAGFQAMDSPSWHLQQLTIDAWVRATDGGDSACCGDDIGAFAVVKVLEDQPHVFPFNSWVLSYSPLDGVFSTIVSPLYVTGVASDYLQSAPGFPAGQFHHAAMTYDGQCLKLYVNSALQGQKCPNALIAYDSWRLGLGAHAFQDGANRDRTVIGEVDEVEIFNRALSESEVQSIFWAGTAGKCKVAPVSIDIKPGSYPNSINLKRKGVIAVAILTTSAFDATTVNPASVRFGRTGAEAAPQQWAFQDVDEDSDTDLILQFPTQQAGIQCGDTVALVKGSTIGGVPIEGSDSIRTVACP